MNAATCCHGNQLIYCWDVFLALIDSINTCGMTGISTLVQFLQLISALSGIQRHHIVKKCFRKIEKISKPAKATSRMKIALLQASRLTLLKQEHEGE